MKNYYYIGSKEQLIEHGFQVKEKQKYALRHINEDLSVFISLESKEKMFDVRPREIRMDDINKDTFEQKYIQDLVNDDLVYISEEKK